MIAIPDGHRRRAIRLPCGKQMSMAFQSDGEDGAWCQAYVWHPDDGRVSAFFRRVRLPQIEIDYQVREIRDINNGIMVEWPVLHFTYKGFGGERDAIRKLERTIPLRVRDRLHIREIRKVST